MNSSALGLWKGKYITNEHLPEMLDWLEKGLRKMSDEANKWYLLKIKHDQSLEISLAADMVSVINKLIQRESE